MVKGDCIAQKELNDDRIFKDVRSCFHEFGKKIHSLCPGEIKSIVSLMYMLVCIYFGY